MRNDWEPHLERWLAAGVLDGAAAGRVRDWEREHARSQGLRWPIRIALAFGALLLGAGILLFVSAHWDELSSGQRMALVVFMVAVFHAGGAAVAERFEGLSIALHATGSMALGAGIALAGQIYHLAEHWPSAMLLWAAGTAAAWALLRHWTQAALTAVLVPFWLGGEWFEHVRVDGPTFMLPVTVGVCALCFTYLSARRALDDSALRKALGWLGGLALLPAASAIAFERWSSMPPWRDQAIAWAIAVAAPLAVAWLLRGREALWNAVAVAWTVLLAACNGGHGDRVPVYLYLWCALGSVGLVAWGIRESRAERINLGIAGFAITVLAFYFSSVMDKLGRSASLIVLGLLFLAGGWFLETTRRRLLSRIRPEAV
jgi:uncharacterized membrane protein